MPQLRVAMALVPNARTAGIEGSGDSRWSGRRMSRRLSEILATFERTRGMDSISAVARPSLIFDANTRRLFVDQQASVIG